GDRPAVGRAHDARRPGACFEPHKDLVLGLPEGNGLRGPRTIPGCFDAEADLVTHLAVLDRELAVASSRAVVREPGDVVASAKLAPQPDTELGNLLPVCIGHDALNPQRPWKANDMWFVSWSDDDISQRRVALAPHVKLHRVARRAVP